LFWPLADIISYSRYYMNSLSWHDRSVESVDDSESPKRSILDISGYSMKVRQNADAQREVLVIQISRAKPCLNFSNGENGSQLSGKYQRVGTIV
jgi:hypothetical protein